MVELRYRGDCRFHPLDALFQNSAVFLGWLVFICLILSESPRLPFASEPSAVMRIDHCRAGGIGAFRKADSSRCKQQATAAKLKPRTPGPAPFTHSRTPGPAPFTRPARLHSRAIHANSCLARCASPCSKAASKTAASPAVIPTDVSRATRLHCETEPCTSLRILKASSSVR